MGIRSLRYLEQQVSNRGTCIASLHPHQLTHRRRNSASIKKNQVILVCGFSLNIWKIKLSHLASSSATQSFLDAVASNLIWAQWLRNCTRGEKNHFSTGTSHSRPSPSSPFQVWNKGDVMDSRWETVDMECSAKKRCSRLADLWKRVKVLGKDRSPKGQLKVSPTDWFIKRQVTEYPLLPGTCSPTGPEGLS